MMQKPPTDTKNLLLAVILSTAILFVWQMAVEAPRQQQAQQAAKTMQQPAAPATAGVSTVVPNAVPAVVEAKRAEAGGVKIDSAKLHGSISLLGARFDNLSLAKYRTAIDPHSPEVKLLSPAQDKDAYFAQFGWISQDPAIKTPDENTIWQADKTLLKPGQPVTLRWDNGTGQLFELRINMDADYLFTLEQRVRNSSAQPVRLAPYAYINRKHAPDKNEYVILHEGPIGVAADTLIEIPYDTLTEEGSQKFNGARGWFGITDKYWLTAMVPNSTETVTASFSHYKSADQDRFQVDYLGTAQEIAPADTFSTTSRFFAGAKELKVLDRYADTYHIPLFDRAVDFGVLYFLTKPIFLLLTFFYSLLGNFGLAILLLTVVVKLILFPLANKSYRAMGQMKKLHPEMLKIRERYSEDKIRMNQEIMALYKREQVNPMAGCLPLLIQIPVFFALYKVLFVSIEMRHAPFYGWIRDLSAPDPTNIFTLFGLIDWNAPSLLHVGIWPLIMSITMIVQQKLNPPPSDPMQARVLGWLPYIFLFLFSSFPAGLVIYWAWSNVLSILQQWLITRKLNPPAKPAESSTPA